MFDITLVCANIMIKIRTCILNEIPACPALKIHSKSTKTSTVETFWCVPPSPFPLPGNNHAARNFTKRPSLTPPGPTVLFRFVSRTRVLVRLSSPSIAPVNRAIRTDRSAIHVERRGSTVAAQCSRIIYADDVETIPCTYVPLHAHTHVQYWPKVWLRFFRFNIPC